MAPKETFYYLRSVFAWLYFNASYLAPKTKTWITLFNVLFICYMSNICIRLFSITSHLPVGYLFPLPSSNVWATTMRNKPHGYGRKLSLNHFCCHQSKLEAPSIKAEVSCFPPSSSGWVWHKHFASPLAFPTAVSDHSLLELKGTADPCSLTKHCGFCSCCFGTLRFGFKPGLQPTRTMSISAPCCPTLNPVMLNPVFLGTTLIFIFRRKGANECCWIVWASSWVWVWLGVEAVVGPKLNPSLVNVWLYK